MRTAGTVSGTNVLSPLGTINTLSATSLTVSGSPVLTSASSVAASTISGSSILTSASLINREQIATGLTRVTEETTVVFDPTNISGNLGTATYGSLQVSCTGGPILLFIVLTSTVSFLYAGTGTNRMTVLVKRDGTQINDPIIVDLTSYTLTTTTATMTTSMLNPVDDTAAAGLHTYSATVTITITGASNTLQVTPSRMTLTALEVR